MSNIERSARAVGNAPRALIQSAVQIGFDPTKNERNIRLRGLSFERARDFDFDSAVVMQDVRSAYPESRFVAIGQLDNRLHVLCFTPIEGGIRVISFRKANTREVKAHERAIPDR